MFFHRLVGISLFVAAVCASPRPQDDATSSCTEYDDGSGSGSYSTTDSTITATSTIIETATSSVSTTSAAPITSPNGNLEVIAARGGSPIHLLPMNAAGLRFYLGGEPVTYCPSSVQQLGDCPPGNETVFSLCSLAVVVPGGQQIYVTPSGEIRYTQAHSSFMPNGSVPCPFTYYKEAETTIGHLSIDAFGADGLMACPTNGGLWQVFASLRNATVPLGNVSQCLGFDALSLDFPLGAAAWQYT